MKYFLMLCIVALIHAQYIEEPLEGSYHRDDYMSRWDDVDRDGLNTRMEVLVKECEPATNIVLSKYNSGGVRVVSGKWICEFSGDTLYNASDLDVDHFVPLGEVHRSGGLLWSDSLKRAYANDTYNHEVLLAVNKWDNRSKGDRDPSEWLPEINQREYVLRWKRIKKLYNLGYDRKELEFITEFLK